MASNTHKYVAKEGRRNFFCRRAPHGARGLKLEQYDDLMTISSSRPARGAWIETLTDTLEQLQDLVAPRTGRVD